MDDREWLATRTGMSLLGGSPFSISERHRCGVVVEPSRVAAISRQAQRSDVPVIAVVGWPDGRHHSVIKATEARLALETGAHEIWFAVDKDCDDANAVLADVIAVRQVVEAPARLGLLYDGRREIVTAAELVGVDTLVVESATAHPTTALDISEFGTTDSLDAVVDALSRGAARVFTAPGVVQKG